AADLDGLAAVGKQRRPGLFQGKGILRRHGALGPPASALTSIRQAASRIKGRPAPRGGGAGVFLPEALSFKSGVRYNPTVPGSSERFLVVLRPLTSSSVPRISVFSGTTPPRWGVAACHVFLVEAHMGKKLYVGNLAWGVTDSTLEQLFSQHGTVESAQVVMDRDTGRSRGFGFVEMRNDQEAEAAIAALTGAQVEGR